jgi:hypothetical protein
MVTFLCIPFLCNVLSGRVSGHIHTDASINKDTPFVPSCQILLCTEWSFPETRLLYLYLMFGLQLGNNRA